MSSNLQDSRGALTVEVDVDTVESDQEVGKDILLGLGNGGEQSTNEGLSARELLVSCLAP